MTTPATRRWPRLEWAALFLAGPAIWYGHFWLVYLLAEGGCFMARQTATGHPLWLVATILATTVAAVALIGWTTHRAWRRWRSSDDSTPGGSALYHIGFLLGPLFAVATIFVGVPAAYLPPC